MRFCSTLIKNQFFLRKDFDLVFRHKNHFLSGFQHFVAVFDVFTRVSFLVLFDRFGRL